MVDPLEILAALGVNKEVNGVESISGGWDTALWRVDAGGHRYAVRVFRAEQAQTCHREALVMRTLGSVGSPPVPAMRAEGVVQGRPALLLGWCPGRPILEDGRAAPWRVWRLGVAMGRAHAQIHAATVTAALMEALPRWAPTRRCRLAKGRPSRCCTSTFTHST